MKTSKICLIAAVVCFLIGAAIFALALFAGMFDKKIAGGIAFGFIMAFLAFCFANVYFRNKELAEEKK